MFDRHIHAPRGPQVARHEHHEHRAPTDESVRLLSEMEKAAESKRIASLQMPGNGFHGVVQVMYAASSNAVIAEAVFDLNGRRFTVAETASVHETRKDRYALLKKLHAAVAEKVASEMLIEMTKGLNFHV